MLCRLTRALAPALFVLLALLAAATPASAQIARSAPAGPTVAPPVTSLDRVVLAVREHLERLQCRPPMDTPIPEMVAEIFRCRLTPMLPEDQVDYAVAEALTVAECESLFDADVVVFDGAYLDTPHPRTGMRYSAAGVFQFIRKTGDKYIEGGYANATNPVANINAAVTLYLESRARGGGGWQDWECSAVNGAFKANSVLPGWPGGPASLPQWALDMAYEGAPFPG